MKLAKISDLFDVKYGVNLELVNLEECLKNERDSINFVSRTEKNNGISAYVERNFDIEPNPANTISVAGGGSVLATFYQHEEYYSGRDLYVLIPKKEYTELEMLYFVYCIRLNKYRYNYGRQANKTLKDIEIPESMPAEWQKIDLDKFKPNSKPLIDKKMELNIDSWKEFEIEEIFNIKSAKVSSKLDLEDWGTGSYPFVTGQVENNGVEGFYDFYNENSKVITIDRIFCNFVAYQPLKFSANDNVKILEPKFEINQYIGIFIATIIKNEKYRYSYGRITSQNRLGKTKIKLPVNHYGQPDWRWMEDYIKSLPFSSSL